MKEGECMVCGSDFGIVELMKIGTKEVSWLVTDGKVVIEVYNNEDDAERLKDLLNDYW